MLKRIIHTGMNKPSFTSRLQAYSNHAIPREIFKSPSKPTRFVHPTNQPKDTPFQKMTSYEARETKKQLDQLIPVIGLSTSLGHSQHQLELISASLKKDGPIRAKDQSKPIALFYSPDTEVSIVEVTDKPDLHKNRIICLGAATCRDPESAVNTFYYYAKVAGFDNINDFSQVCGGAIFVLPNTHRKADESATVKWMIDKKVKVPTENEYPIQYHIYEKLIHQKLFRNDNSPVDPKDFRQIFFTCSHTSRYVDIILTICYHKLLDAGVKDTAPYLKNIYSINFATNPYNYKKSWTEGWRRKVFELGQKDEICNLGDAATRFVDETIDPLAKFIASGHTKLIATFNTVNPIQTGRILRVINANIEPFTYGHSLKQSVEGLLADLTHNSFVRAFRKFLIGSITQKEFHAARIDRTEPWNIDQNPQVTAMHALAPLSPEHLAFIKARTDCLRKEVELCGTYKMEDVIRFYQVDCSGLPIRNTKGIRIN